MQEQIDIINAILEVVMVIIIKEIPPQKKRFCWNSLCKRLRLIVFGLYFFSSLMKSNSVQF